MSFGITKTVPSKEGVQAIESLYDGSLSEFEFHMAGKPSRLNVGDYVHTIFNDEMHGRLKIKELIPGAVNPASGKARTLIMVEAPGEKLKNTFPHKGHRGTRYYDNEAWPKPE